MDLFDSQALQVLTCSADVLPLQQAFLIVCDWPSGRQAMSAKNGSGGKSAPKAPDKRVTRSMSNNSSFRLKIIMGKNDLSLLPPVTCHECEQSTHDIDRQKVKAPLEEGDVEELLKWKNFHKGKKIAFRTSVVASPTGRSAIRASPPGGSTLI